MLIVLEDLKISLGPSLKHISKVACMAISGNLENGLVLSCNPEAYIIIHKDRIDFGECLNPELEGFSGLIFPNFYMEYGNIVYRFGRNYKVSLFGAKLDYVGTMAPTTPDNEPLFNLIYPRFA